MLDCVETGYIIFGIGWKACQHGLDNSMVLAMGLSISSTSTVISHVLGLSIVGSARIPWEAGGHDQIC